MKRRNTKRERKQPCDVAQAIAFVRIACSAIPLLHRSHCHQSPFWGTEGGSSIFLISISFCSVTVSL